jgi:hypothetical protein
MGETDAALLDNAWWSHELQIPFANKTLGSDRRHFKAKGNEPPRSQRPQRKAGNDQMTNVRGWMFDVRSSMTVAAVSFNRKSQI